MHEDSNGFTMFTFHVKKANKPKEEAKLAVVSKRLAVSSPPSFPEMRENRVSLFGDLH